MRKVKRRREQETGSCSLEKLTGANGPQTKYKMEIICAIRLRALGVPGVWRRMTHFQKRTLWKVSLELGFEG